MAYDRVSIGAKVVADSIHKGSRLTTFEVTFPRFILAEFNTHRVLSRNSASSRAIPVWKRLADIIMYPFIPLQFGRNKAGMQSAEGVSESDNAAARENWLVGSDVAVIQAFFLAGGQSQIMKDAKDDPRALEVCQRVEILGDEYPDVISQMRRLSAGVHKQHANRVLEPYAWHTVIVTATHWRNFYALRASPMAQPEIQELALAMAQVHQQSVPRELLEGEWHLPYVFDKDLREFGNYHDHAEISSARCARVSYLTHEGKRDPDADFKLAKHLQSSGHMSPFEHPARTRDMTGSYHESYNGNFGKVWMQYRKMLKDEHDFSKLIEPTSILEGMRGDQELADFVLSLSD